MEHNDMYKEKLKIAAKVCKNQNIEAAMKKLQDLGCTDAMNLEEIATVMNITRERVRQIEDSALRKLRHPKLGRKLNQYYTENYSVADILQINGEIYDYSN